jgi:hypothetical protein
LPTIIYINDKVAIVECKYVPSYGQGEEQAAALVEAHICRPNCGIWKDAALKNQEKYNKSQGKEEFRLMCLHPTSPYLEELKKKIRETGKLE